MNVLLGTVDGWASTVRSIRWPPLIAAPAASATFLVAGALAGADPPSMSVVGETGLAFTAVAAAFVADDPTGEAAPGTPVEARARLVSRAVLVAPVTLAGWLLVLALYASVTPGLPVDLPSRMSSGLGLTTAALALGTGAGRLWPSASPGAAGMAVMAAVGIAAEALSGRWMTHLPSGELAWPATVVVSLLVICATTKEPASS